MKKFLLASAAVAALATGAQAADLGAPRAPVAAAVMAPAFSWTGFYVGAFAGYGWNNFNVIGPGTGTGNGPLLGGTIGYNYQINQFVLGAEADLAFAAVTGRVTAVPAFSLRTNMLGSVRARAGFAVDRALFYVTGGLGIQNAALAQNGVAVERFTRTGWTLGGGVEYALTQNWTAKIEYNYYNFGTRAAGAAIGLPVRNEIHTVKLGVNYLFSTGPSAVVARY
ncbi:outer membrane protein [Phreatobacter sp.]|uniref:outer membrane protein n=1 Tax=Phreatobacter sp. TaxID=1966341 RepID=UPI0022C65403|nr:outer membrane protein [Phreatobacter sp.]MCZ8316413.1 porin family protein [Phreatobacter sp.]